jgi:hypothetical protein
MYAVWISEDRISSIIRVERIRELGRTLLFTANIVSGSLIIFVLIMEAVRFTETSVLRDPHDVTSQKAAYFIVASVNT